MLNGQVQKVIKKPLPIEIKTLKKKFNVLLKYSTDMASYKKETKVTILSSIS